MGQGGWESKGKGGVSRAAFFHCVRNFSTKKRLKTRGKRRGEEEGLTLAVRRKEVHLWWLIGGNI